ncbi:MAG: TOBE domain-containing protein [Pyramidobacter sp.]
MVRPENLILGGGDNALPVTVTHYLFEGDRLDYYARLGVPGCDKDLNLSVPFLPGKSICSAGTETTVSFLPEGAVIIAKQ